MELILAVRILFSQGVAGGADYKPAKHKIYRLSKAQNAMRVLRRVSWFKAVRHYLYRFP